MRVSGTHSITSITRIQQNSSINKYRKSSRSQLRTYNIRIQVWNEKKYTKTWHKWFAQTRQKSMSCSVDRYIHKYTGVAKGAT